MVVFGECEGLYVMDVFGDVVDCVGKELVDKGRVNGDDIICVRFVL